MPSEEELSAIKTWSIIGAIAVGFLAWGMLIYFVIGDKGPPAGTSVLSPTSRVNRSILPIARSIRTV